MKVDTLKFVAFVSVVALSTANIKNSFAQTETVNATLTVSSAITTTDISNMDFGTWLVQFVAGDAPVITLSNDGTVASTQTGSVVNGSQVVQVTAPATEGVVNVRTPAPATLTITRSASADFPSPALSLATVSYRTANDGTNALNADAATGTVTTLVAATDEPVRFGGTVSVTATPADAIHAAQFDVTFSY
ncbi:MAG: hypothetical protein OEY94_05930 [Alphaproteobacteria bacterium]|nr:hypothetical protein [Alphaproteobacteria bacterium]